MITELEYSELVKIADSYFLDNPGVESVWINIRSDEVIDYLDKHEITRDWIQIKHE